jgi:hypothetical protein
MVPWGRGSHPGGGKRGLFQEKQIVWVSPRSGPAANFVHKYRNVTHLCFNSLLSYSSLAENYRFSRAGVSYRSSFFFSPVWEILIISFTWIRVSAVHPLSSRCISPFLLTPRVVMAPKRYGPTSSTSENAMVICFWSQKIKRARALARCSTFRFPHQNIHQKWTTGQGRFATQILKLKQPQLKYNLIQVTWA